MQTPRKITLTQFAAWRHSSAVLSDVTIGSVPFGGGYQSVKVDDL